MTPAWRAWVSTERAIAGESLEDLMVLRSHASENYCFALGAGVVLVTAPGRALLAFVRSSST